jgi:hypothetical protein
MSDSSTEKLKAELAVAQQAQHSLEEQKCANLVLKETIDRLRLDLDEIRNSHSSEANLSAPNSLGVAGGLHAKTKGSKNKKAFPSLAAELGEYDAPTVVVEEDAQSTTTTEEHDSDAYDEEIITTRRRRVSFRYLFIILMPDRVLDTS